MERCLWSNFCNGAIFADSLNRRSKSPRIALSLLSISDFSNVCHFACIWPTSLKLEIANVDMPFLVMGLIDESTYANFEQSLFHLLHPFPPPPLPPTIFP